MERDDGDDEVIADVVAYLVIQVADRDALATLGPALEELTSSSSVRVLDVAAVAVDELAAVHELPFEEVVAPVVITLAPAVQGELLSARDVRLAACALPPGSAGVVLLTEDRWAAGLAAAARAVGGRIVGGERILPSRVERALVDADDWNGRSA